MIEAYCWPQSVVPGEPVALHLSTYAPTVQIEVARDGAERETVWRGEAEGAFYPTPDDASSHGCGWPAALEIPVGADWRSGYYAVTVTAGDQRADAFLVVRSAPGAEPAPILMVLSTSTWNAYNDWGGPSLYTGGTRVSFERPMAPGFLVKPEPHRRKSQPTPDREALWFFEWAEPLGLSVWSGGAGWWNWERPFFRWAEANGFRVDLAVSQDLEAHPDDPRRTPDAALRGPRRVLVVGYARDRRTVHRRRWERRVLQRQHVLLAGPVRGRPPAHGRVQVRRRPGPGARHRRGAVRHERLGRPPDRLDASSRRSGSRSRGAGTRATGSASRTRAAPTRSGDPTTGRSRAPTSRTATRWASRTRSSPTRSTGAS